VERVVPLAQFDRLISAASVDQIISATNQHGWNREAQSPGRLEVDHKAANRLF